MFKKLRIRSFRKRASSLITTLLVVVVLTIIVVAFMQSMAIERLTSKSYAGIYRADLLADAATEAAVNRIQTAIEPKPYSAVYAVDAIGGQDARFLYLASYTNKSGSLVTERVPLFSTLYSDFSLYDSSNQPAIETTTIAVSDWTAEDGVITRNPTNADDLYANLNSANYYYPQGVVGLTNVVLPGNWIYQTNASGAVIGRYAFWVDDETSKIDLRTAGTETRGAGTNLAELALSTFTNVGLSAEQVDNLVNYKDQSFEGKSPSATRYDLDGADAIADPGLWNRLRPFLTQYSLHDLRSPDGNLSINLNELVTSTNSPTVIQEQVETITAAITNNLPSFGERYFQATAPDSDQQLKYVKKIAANIRDYIDTDNTATVILEDGSAYTGTEPDFIDYVFDADEVPVFGKESGPYLNEFALVTRVISPFPEGTSSSGDVTITIRFGHYIELLNLSPQPISYSDLGPNPRIIIANIMNWNNKRTGSPTLRPDDVQLNLPIDFVIPANGYAVLTTDGPPWNSSNQSDFLNVSGNLYQLTRGTGPGTWSPLGTLGKDTPSGATYEDYTVLTEYLSSNRYNLQPTPSNSSYDDCQERLLFVNDDGLIDYEPVIFTAGNRYLGRLVRNPTSFSTFVSDGNTDNNNANPESTSTPRLVRGDPRSNSEVSEPDANTSKSWKSGNSPQYGDQLGALQMTLGADNYNWNISTGNGNIARVGWAEFASVGNHIVANTNMVSIGELGFIYDPARYSFDQYRTYGRTLRVGQPDDPSVNRSLNSTSTLDRNWIGGLGTNSPAATNYMKNAFLLANVFRTDNVTQGKINPNGIIRAADQPLVGAIFTGFEFDPTGNYQATGVLDGKDINTNAFYQAVTNEIASYRPFLGIGDISRLDTFATNLPSAGIASNQNMATYTVSDGDREETFRRIAGLISTQSLSYSIYVIGQSGRFVGDDFRPTSTVRKHTVVQFQPSYSSTTFPAKPDSWTISRPWHMNLH